MTYHSKALLLLYLTITHPHTHTHTHTHTHMDTQIYELGTDLHFKCEIDARGIPGEAKPQTEEEEEKKE
jgi:hypothetical protein